MRSFFVRNRPDIYKTRYFIYSLVEYVIQKTICNLILAYWFVFNRKDKNCLINILCCLQFSRNSKSYTTSITD